MRGDICKPLFDLTKELLRISKEHSKLNSKQTTSYQVRKMSKNHEQSFQQRMYKSQINQGKVIVAFLLFIFLRFLVWFDLIGFQARPVNAQVLLYSGITPASLTSAKLSYLVSCGYVSQNGKTVARLLSNHSDVVGLILDYLSETNVIPGVQTWRPGRLKHWFQNDALWNNLSFDVDYSQRAWAFLEANKE